MSKKKKNSIPKDDATKTKEFIDIMKYAYSPNRRFEALRKFKDVYDCPQTRDYLKLIARRDECHKVRLEAHGLLQNMGIRFKYVNPDKKKIETYSTYHLIRDYIKRTSESLGITSADEFDNDEIWSKFYAEFHKAYPSGSDLLQSKFFGKEKRILFVKKEYTDIFGEEREDTN